MGEMEIDNQAESYADISPDSDGKLLKRTIQEGEGEEKPFTGSKVHVHYEGKLESGEIFDSSRSRGDVFSFKAGSNSVIKGWDIAVLTMRKNEICELKIHPDFAYGEAGFPPKIPENATLIFQIELLSWEDEEITPDKGVIKRVIKEGEGNSRPKIDSHVKVHIRESYEGVLCSERDIEFTIGEGYAHGIVDGVEKALCCMRKHERALVYVQSQYAYRDKGHDDYNIPPHADIIEYDICLFNFEKPKEIYEMDYDEKLVKAQSLKDHGLRCFKAKEFEKAIDYYDRVIKCVRINKEDSDYQRGLPFKVAAHSNKALCYLKLNDFINAKLNCEKVLKFDQNNIKAHFRLAEAYVGLGEYRTAIASFENVLKLEPENKAAAIENSKCKQLLKKQTEKEKKLYGHMFFS